jgi:hypothetical protein
VSAPPPCPVCGTPDCDHARRARRALELAGQYTLEDWPLDLPPTEQEPTAWD